MATLKNTIRHHVRMKMKKKTLLLILLAAALAFLSYTASAKAIVTGSQNYQLLYSIGSVVLSVAVFLFVAFKIRYFQTLFSRDWSGKVIKTENFVAIIQHITQHDILGFCLTLSQDIVYNDYVAANGTLYSTQTTIYNKEEEKK